jgi:hypothetical protein
MKNKPSSQKLQQFYEWLKSELEMSKAYYSPGGQKVARNHWMPPSIRIQLERILRDLDIQ